MKKTFLYVFMGIILLGIIITLNPFIVRPTTRITKTFYTPTGSYTLELLTDKIQLLSNTHQQKFWYPLKTGEKVIDSLVTTRISEEPSSLIVIFGDNNSTYGHRLEIFPLSKPGELKPVIRESMKNMNPWKLQAADVNGDSTQELSITVFKKTKFHPVMANRPFLYTWNKQNIAPLWRGSRLSRPFTEYTFCDLNGDKKEEIVAIESLKDGTQVVQAYGMIGFGFEGLAQSKPYAKLKDLVKEPIAQTVSVKTQAKNKVSTYKLVLKNQTLTLVKN